MKKSLLALAVLGAFAGSASAQSSVTMYGWLDIGYQYNQLGVNKGTSAKPDWQKESVSQIESGYVNGNRLGVKGSEAISPNLNAIFQLEMGFSLDTGASGQGSGKDTTMAPYGRLFGRQAYAGLAGNWGGLVFGRIAALSSGTGAFDMFGAVDPFETGYGINSLGSTFIMANSVRADNAIAYVSPTWGGFKFGAAYSTNINQQETAPQNTNTSLVDLAASFTWKDLYVVATYDIVSFPANKGCADPSAPVGTYNPTCPDQKMFQFGATYDFKIVKIYGAYANQSDISGVTTGDIGGTFKIPGAVGYYDNSAWMLGVSVPIAGGKYGTIRGSYQMSDAKNIQRNLAGGTAVTWEPDYNVWGIGYNYNLSNRTMLYAGYGQRSLKSNPSSGSIVAGGASTAFDKDQFAVGLNHRF